MSGQWFYRMFGEEFGPVPFEKLKELAEGGTIQAADEVRSETVDQWIAAEEVDGLGLSASDHDTVTATLPTSGTDFEISTPAATDEWFCLVAGAELGPLSFDELLKFAEHEQLSADDQVRLGANGKWRRAGSIGRLMAALPYKAHEKKIVPGQKPKVDQSEPEIDDFNFDGPTVVASTVLTPPEPELAPLPTVDVQATYRAAYEQAKAMVAESMLAQADAAFKAAEEQAQAQIAWTKGPNVDRFWWGWANGVEFGPVEFTQVFGLAKMGQLKPSDLVRNGQVGQFVPSSSVPGLFKAIEMIVRATEARNLAKAQAQAAAALAAPAPAMPEALLKSGEMKTVSPIPVAPKSDPVVPTQSVGRSSPSINTVPQRGGSSAQVRARILDPEPEPEREPEPPPRPAPVAPEPSRPAAYNPYAASGGFSSSSSSMSTYGTSRPAAAPPKTAPRRSSGSSSTWLSDTLESLKEPKALGTIAAVAVVLLVVGWTYLPKSRAGDIKMYQALKSVVEEIRTKRVNSPGDVGALQQKLQKVGKEIAAELKNKASRDEPAKQCLLWASRDEVPRVITAGLNTESAAEKALMSRLQEAAYELGLEKRPPIDMAQLVNANND